MLTNINKRYTLDTDSLLKWINNRLRVNDKILRDCRSKDLRLIIQGEENVLNELLRLLVRIKL
jgi:hypothetical protein